MGVKKIIAVFDYVDFAIAWFHMFIMNITHQDVCIDSCLCDNRISENGIVGSNMVLHLAFNICELRIIDIDLLINLLRFCGKHDLFS